MFSQRGRRDIIEVAKVLFDKGSAIHNRLGIIESNSLEHAINYSKNEKLIEFLIDRGAEINQPGGHYNMSTLELASYPRNFSKDVVKTIIKKGARLDIESQYTVKYLVEGSKGQNGKEEMDMEFVDFLLKNGLQPQILPPNHPDRSNLLERIEEMRQENKEIVKELGKYSNSKSGIKNLSEDLISKIAGYAVEKPNSFIDNTTTEKHEERASNISESYNKALSSRKKAKSWDEQLDDQKTRKDAIKESKEEVSNKEDEVRPSSFVQKISEESEDKDRSR